MDTDNFKNGLTFRKEETIVFARGITASICGGILLLVLVVLVILAIRPNSRDRMCGSVKKRLTIWLTAVTALAELFQSLSLIYYYSTMDLPIPDSHNMAFCQADGFLTQYFGTVQLLFTLWVSLTFFFEVCGATQRPRCINIDEDSRCCGCKKKMLLEVGLCFVIFTIPLINALLFIPDSNGSIGPWCWIQSLKENCSNNTSVPHILQIVLWNVPYGLVALLTLVLFIVALSLLRRTIRRCNLGLTNSIIIFVFLIITNAMCILELTTCITLIFRCDHHDTWVAYAVSAPLGQLAIPLALLVAVHLPLFCKRHKRRKRRRGQRERRNETATVHDSSNTDVPSDTEWYPPHSEQPEAEQEERTPIFHENNANVD